MIHAIDAGQRTPAKRILSAAQLAKFEPSVPLSVNACLDDALIQVSDNVPPGFLTQYLYVSSSSERLVRRFEAFAGTLVSRFVTPGAGRIGNIGNIGNRHLAPLAAARALGAEVTGIGPATNLVEIAAAGGLDIATIANICGTDGVISIGAGSGIGENTVVVAVKHRAQLDTPILNEPRDDRRTGVTIGTNVWVGANCVLLAGCSVGDNSVIGAGSVVRGEVPAGEIRGGVPARLIKRL